MEFAIFIILALIIIVIFYAPNKKEQSPNPNTSSNSSPKSFYSSSPKSYDQNIAGVNPETDNEFMFYEFVKKTDNYILEPWIKKAKETGYKVKLAYQIAVNEKITTGSFINPHRFPEYFDSKFDYIAIDFETANNSRLSACAVGLVFIKNKRLVHSAKYFIKPPRGQNFLQSHIDIHGIERKDVVLGLNFKEWWDYEFHKYLCCNLVIFHNASMDLSILKNMFEHYKIPSFEISYIDTMYFADKLGFSKKLDDLVKLFDIEIKERHDPEADAELCAEVFESLTERYAGDYRDLIKKIDSKPKTEYKNNNASEEIILENKKYKEGYCINLEDLHQMEIANKGFVVTGTFKIDREIIKTFLLREGGLIKPGITGRVNYVIAGDNCGWAKIQKVNEMNQSGKATIKIISEPELEFLFEKYQSLKKNES